MSDGPHLLRTRARRAGLAGVAVIAVVGLVVLVAHIPPVRRAALQYAIAVIQDRYRLRIDVATLDYNLATLRFGLTGVRIAADRTPSLPFLEAAALDVTLASSAIAGDVAFDDVRVTGGRVHIVRTADGRTNLPEGAGASSGDPPPLRIRHIGIPRLAVDVTDQAAGFALDIPALDVDLAAAGGRIALSEPARIAMGSHSSRVSQLAGNASFDGRALQLSNVQIRSDEVSGRVDATVALIAKDPALDLRIGGTGDVARLAAWAMAPDDLPSGTMAFTGRVSGAFGNPVAEVRVSSGELRWQRLVATALSASARVTMTGADLQSAAFVVAGGRVSATGAVAYDSSAESRITASWSGVDLASVAAMTMPAAARGGVGPAGRSSGQLDARGTRIGLTAWVADGRTHLEAAPNAPGRIAMPGDLHLQLSAGAWRVDGALRMGDVSPVSIAIGGRLDETALMDSTIAGDVHVAATNAPLLMRAVRMVSGANAPSGRADGIPTASNDLIRTGTVAADAHLSGRLGDPETDARVTVRDLMGVWRTPDRSARKQTAIAEIDQVEADRIDVVLAGHPVRAQLEFTATSDAAMVAGQSLQGLQARGRFAGETLVLDLLAAGEPAQHGTLTAMGRYDLGREEYELTGHVTGWPITPTADIPISARVDVSLRGDGTLARPRGDADVTMASASWKDIALGDVTALVQLDGERARVTASAPQFHASADASTTLSAPYTAVIDARAQDVDLAPLIREACSSVRLAGTATVAAHAEGPLDAWRTGAATLDILALNATAGELPVRLSGPARLTYDAERVRVARLEVDAGETHVSAEGGLPAWTSSARPPGSPDAAGSRDALIVTATGDVGQLVRAIAATGVTQIPVQGGSGPVAVLARVTGSIEIPELAADIEVGPGSLAIADRAAITALSVRAHVERDVIELREMAGVYQGAQMTATGTVPLGWVTSQPTAPGAAASLTARATGLTPGALEPWVDASTLQDLAGSVDLSLDVASASRDLSQMTGELRVDRLDLRVADVPITQRSPTRIVARDGFARIESWDWAGQGATLEVLGQVRLADRQAAILASGELDLRLLTPLIRDAGIRTAGTLRPRLSITGTIETPRVDGDLTLDAGDVRLLDPRIAISNLAGRVVLSGTTAHLVSLTGSINGGALTGTGTGAYLPDAEVTAQLSAEVRGMALEFPAGLRSEIDGMLTLDVAAGAGTPEPGGRVSGTVTVVRGAYRQPLAVLTGLLASLRTQSSADGGTRSALLDRLVLDVRIQTDEDLIVDNNYGRFQVGADLQLVGTAAAPAFSGRADLREGGQLFLGRNVYRIDSGTIDFANTTIIEPELNVQATTRAGGEDIVVTLRGTPETLTPELRSSSDPSLGQADLAALLLTGRQFDQLAATDAAFVGEQVLGNLSGEVLGFAGHAIGLDTLRLGGVDTSTTTRDPSAVATETDPTSRLTFGKRLGADVDLTFSQSLRKGDAQTWIVDYLPSRHLDLRLVSNDDDLRSYELRHELSFGGGAPRVEPAGAPSAAPVRVAKVTLDGELGFPETRIRNLLKLTEGDAFDFARWQEDRDRLRDFYAKAGYLTSRVGARRIDGADGVALAYDVTAGPRTTIAVSGAKLGDRVVTRLRDAWSESFLDDALVDDATSIVRSALAEDGYLQATIMARLVDGSEGRTLDISIEPGPRTSDIRVRIAGPDEGLIRQVNEWIEAQGLNRDAVRDPDALRVALTAWLQGQGWLEARVTIGTPASDGGVATVPVTIEQGSGFMVGDIRFDGAAGLTGDMLREAVALVPGTPYDPAAVDAARDRLLALYRREGFASAAAMVRQDRRRPDNLVDVTFVIREGARRTVGEVVVSGNRGIDADVITRAMKLSLSGPLRADDLLQARRRVFDTGLFRRVDLMTEPLERAAGPAGQEPPDRRPEANVMPMRLRVAVDEWPALRLRYGFQAAEERPESEPTGRTLVAGLSADLTRRTLFGRAIAVGGAIVLQRREQTARAFLTAPTFLSKALESSLVLEQSRQVFAAATLVTDRRGISWEQRTRPIRHLTFSYAYRYERNHTFDTGPSRNPDFPAFDITINVARLTGNTAWDTRDDAVDTARGTLLSSSFEWGPASLGSDFQFIRHLAQAYHFTPWRRLIFASAARLGVVTPLGGQEIIPSERFFAGGARSVRGVADDSLGEKDFLGDPAGGTALLLLNQEVRFPIYRWVGGVGFVDAGNVFAKPRDLSLGALTGSLGGGLRFATPFALLRVDYGRVAWGGVPQGTGRWVFGIGHTF